MKEAVNIALYVGSFESQPLVYAHLLDTLPWLNLDHVEVICRTNPVPRLAHYLSQEDVQQIEDAMGLADTCVMIFEDTVPNTANLPNQTPYLSGLGWFAGQRLRPD